MIPYSTPVPNILFDEYLLRLNQSELKVVLVVIRKTYGWRHPKNPKKRKCRDRISISQFQKLTGLSNKSIADAITSLIKQSIIEAQDYARFPLKTPQERKGVKYIFYTCLLKPVKKVSPTSEVFNKNQPQNLHITKESTTKEKRQKDLMKDELRRVGNFDALMEAKGIIVMVDRKITMNKNKVQEYMLWKRVYNEMQDY